jgi:hypothetical protein
MGDSLKIEEKQLTEEEMMSMDREELIKHIKMLKAKKKVLTIIKIYSGHLNLAVL